MDIDSRATPFLDKLRKQLGNSAVSMLMADEEEGSLGHFDVPKWWCQLAGAPYLIVWPLI
jgi:hypothetical protein